MLMSEMEVTEDDMLSNNAGMKVMTLKKINSVVMLRIVAIYINSTIVARSAA